MRGGDRRGRGLLSPRGQTTRARNGRPTREESEALERRLLAVALEVFLDHGYDATTMEAIADAADITKRTLYAKFPDKRALFLAVVPPALADMPHVDEVLDVPDNDLEAALRAIAHGVVARVTDPHAVRLRRLAVREADRFPEFAHTTNMELWFRSVRRVVDLLEEHRRLGNVEIEDVSMAADHFMVLVAGGPTILSDLGVFREEDDQRRHTDHAVSIFLRGVVPR